MSEPEIGSLASPLLRIMQFSNQMLVLVNDSLVVELKAVKTLAPEHFAQILNYLKITHSPVGLLINFGSYKFERRTITA